uniref:TNase-like domain-containing protein n=1 Tax=Electrophorus electricus TaxID=8005 RepID=A0A4W4F9I9_ELEEL
LAVAGVITIATSIKLITRFGSPSEIPVRFIERTVSIRGRVRRVTDRGLEVEHVPIWLTRGLFFCPPAGQPVAAPLHVRLAGVELTPQGQDWLAQRLRPEEAVWLRLIGRQGDCLHCLVSGLLFSTCVNQEVLRLGLGRTAPLHGLDPRSRLYWKIHKRLLRSELKAERKGEGLWKEPSRSERLIHKRFYSDGMLKGKSALPSSSCGHFDEESICQFWIRLFSHGPTRGSPSKMCFPTRSRFII